MYVMLSIALFICLSAWDVNVGQAKKSLKTFKIFHQQCPKRQIKILTLIDNLEFS